MVMKTSSVWAAAGRVAVLFTALMVSRAASGSTLLQSSFVGPSPALNQPWTATSSLDPAIAFAGWTSGPNLETPPTDDAFAFSVTASATDSTLAEALAAGAYLACTLQPSGSGTLDLGGVQVNLLVRRSSWWAPRRYAAFTSVSGFTEGTEIFVSESFEHGDNSARTLSFFLPETGFDGLNGPLELRVVAFEARYGGHEAALDGFSLVSGIAHFTLSVSAMGGGTAAAVPDKPVFADGETALLAATAAPGYRFAGWSGAVTGLGNPRALPIDRDLAVTAHFESLPPLGMRVGTNLNGVTDWSSAWVFKDVFQRFRTWLTRNADSSGAWDTALGYTIPTDAEGWPLAVPFDPGTGDPAQMVHSILVSGNDAGAYTLFYEGSGSFQVRVDDQAWQYPPSDGGAHTYPLTLARHSMVTLQISSSGPAPNHLRKFHLVPDALIGDFPTQPFHPVFLDRARGFDHFRFMDWGQTNNSPLQTWAARTTAAAYTQTRGEGVALEHMVALGNTLEGDVWICLPHAADDDYVNRTALLLRDSLAPERRLYVEYSNETWNGIFYQTTYVQDAGEALGLASDRWTAGQRFVALRSTQIWKIFEDVFGADAGTRLVKVLATQSANPSVTQMRVTALNDPALNPDCVYPDALALAPYFGHNYSTAELPPNTAAYPTVDEIIDVIAVDEIAAIESHLAAQKAIAVQQGMQLICYEGGQHFTGLGAANSDTTLTGLLTSANRDPRIYRRYEEYLDVLEAAGVEVFSNFTLTGAWGRYGSWGSLEAIDQPIGEAPKYAALKDWIAENIHGDHLLRIQNISTQGDELTFDWRSKPAHTYRIETSSDLESWTPGMTSMPSAGLSTSITIPDSSGDHPAFFRICEE